MSGVSGSSSTLPSTSVLRGRFLGEPAEGAGGDPNHRDAESDPEQVRTAKGGYRRGEKVESDPEQVRTVKGGYRPAKKKLSADGGGGKVIV